MNTTKESLLEFHRENVRDKSTQIIYPIVKNCNLSCIGCTSYSDLPESKTMNSVHTWEEDLDLISDVLKSKRIGITGGEPFLHKDLKRILLKAMDKFLAVTVHTNGLLLNSNSWIIEFLKQGHNVNFVVSIHNDISVHTKYAEILHASLTNMVAELTGVSFQDVKDTLNQTAHLHQDPEVDYLHYFPEIHMVVVKGFNLAIRFSHLVWQSPALTPGGLPVAYNNDPQDAYRDCFCPQLHYKDKKLYKCPVTLFLPDILEARGETDNWPELQAFKPYDLLKPDPAELERLTHAEPVCTHCPLDSQRTYENLGDSQTKLLIAKS